MYPFIKKNYGQASGRDAFNDEHASNQVFTNKSIESDEDIQEELRSKKQRYAQLYWNQGFLCITIAMAWMFGTFGFSIAWVMILAVLIHMVMWGSFARLLENSINYEKRTIHRKKALQHDETVEWLNFIINRWWIFSSASIFSWLKGHVEPMINEALPSLLETVLLKTCTFGDKTPFITSMRAFDTNSANRTTFSSFMKAMPNKNVKSNLIHSLQYRLQLQADVGVICPDFQLAFTGKVFPGVDVDLIFENLQVFGQVQAMIQFSMDAPFPHISKATITFLEKPNVMFDVRLLRTTEMMSLLGIQDWFKSLVMDILTEAMVDPFQLELNFVKMDCLSPTLIAEDSLSEGVLAVTLEWLHRSGEDISSGRKRDDERWCVLRLGNQKYITAKSNISSRWSEKQSFLVRKLSNDKITIKIKTKRLIGTSTLAEFQFILNECFQSGLCFYENNLQKNGICYLHFGMQYIPLSPILLGMDGEDEVDNPGEQAGMDDSHTTAGVVYLHIHGADDLSLPPDGECLPNPYCAVFCNTKKIRTTKFVNQTCNPRWETTMEFLVTDFNQTLIQFGICNYDALKMVADNFLGLGTFDLNSLDRDARMHCQTISLDTSADAGPTYKKQGTITFSLMFSPVASVEHSGISEYCS